MSMKIYVGNLAFQTLRRDLKQLFSQVESESLVEYRETGRSRGFGFVEMSSKEEGEAAIAQFNSKGIVDPKLNVNEIRARKRRRRGGLGPVSPVLELGRVGAATEEFEIVEIVAKNDLQSAGDTTIEFGPAQDKQITQYFSEIAESRKRARKTQTEINRVKKKTAAILDKLS